MKLARGHVLIGINDEALLDGARDVEVALRRGLLDAGLGDEIQVIETGDLGFAGRGVVLVIHPDEVTYGHVAVADVPEIINEHLLKGRPVERLRIAPRASVTGLVKHQPRIVLENCGVIDPESLEEAIAAGAYQALAKVLKGSSLPKL